MLREARTTEADDAVIPLWTDTDRATGAFAAAGTVACGAALLAAAVGVDLWAVPFFFFLVVVVAGVPSRSAPDSNTAVKKFEKRRIM
jgi:hypothetical protein